MIVKILLCYNFFIHALIDEENIHIYCNCLTLNYITLLLYDLKNINSLIWYSNTKPLNFAVIHVLRRRWFYILAGVIDITNFIWAIKYIIELYTQFFDIYQNDSSYIDVSNRHLVYVMLRLKIYVFKIILKLS